MAEEIRRAVGASGAYSNEENKCSGS